MLTLISVTHNEVTYTLPDLLPMPDNCCLSNITFNFFEDTSDVLDLNSITQSFQVAFDFSNATLDAVAVPGGINYTISNVGYCDLGNPTAIFFTVSVGGTDFDFYANTFLEIVANLTVLSTDEIDFGIVQVGTTKAIQFTYTPAEAGQIVNVYLDCSNGNTPLGLTSIEYIPFLVGEAAFVTTADPKVYTLVFAPTNVNQYLNGCVLYLCTGTNNNAPFCCREIELSGIGLIPTESTTEEDLIAEVCIKKTNCHNYTVNHGVDFTFVAKDYLGNTISEGNQDNNTIVTPIDGIYFVDVVYLVGEVVTTITHVIFDFCNLFDCVKKIINNLLCAKGDDPCCEKCDEKEDMKMRHELNKIMAVYWTLNSKLSAYRHLNDGINCYTSERVYKVEEIKLLSDYLVDLVTRCGECKKKGITIKPCTGC